MRYTPSPSRLLLALALLSVAASAVVASAGCQRRPARPAPPSTVAASSEVTPVNRSSLLAFGLLPTVVGSKRNPLTDDKIALGRLLFFDTRLSKNQDISCNSCHDLATYGAESTSTSIGHRGQIGSRNAPTVYNAAGHVAQFWDGRAADVEEQAKGPVLNPIEMAAVDESHVVAVLASIPGYVARFEQVWPDDPAPVTFQHVADAIGAFERTLVTPSRWDRYLAGDTTALAATEQRGLHLFLQSGCHRCHYGTYVGGQAFQKLGQEKPWPSDADLGRFEATRLPADRLYFKVPSLRNVARTAPYFHDGSVPDLPSAVRMMGWYQLGRTLPEEDVQAIVAFLASLTGELPAECLMAPELPPSGLATPEPDPS